MECSAEVAFYDDGALQLHICSLEYGHTSFHACTCGMTWGYGGGMVGVAN